MASVSSDASAYDPLLCDQPDVEAQSHHVEYTPLPKLQLSALCCVRIIDPIAFTQLFPYVNEFMNDLRLTDDPSRIGFYSGLVVSLVLSSFSLSLAVADKATVAFVRKESICAIFQLFSIYQWAAVSGESCHCSSYHTHLIRLSYRCHWPPACYTHWNHGSCRYNPTLRVFAVPYPGSCFSCSRCVTMIYCPYHSFIVF
jgi:hypothetical protein